MNKYISNKKSIIIEQRRIKFLFFFFFREYAYKNTDKNYVYQNYFINS